MCDGSIRADADAETRIMLDVLAFTGHVRRLINQAGPLKRRGRSTGARSFSRVRRRRRR